MFPNLSIAAINGADERLLIETRFQGRIHWAYRTFASRTPLIKKGPTWKHNST
jgi:hypothetical protein